MNRHPFSLCWSKKNRHQPDTPILKKTDTPFPSVTWLKTDTPQKTKTRQVQECIKPLTNGGDRNLGVKVIPMDYQRKREER